MQEWLGNNDVLMYYAHNEGKTRIIERFIKTLKSKIYKKNMTANDSKSYHSYLNKLVNQYNITYHHSTIKKPLNAVSYALTENIESNPEAPKFKVTNIVRITKYEKIFNTVLKVGQEKYLLLILFYKLTLGYIKLKI